MSHQFVPTGRLTAVAATTGVANVTPNASRYKVSNNGGNVTTGAELVLDARAAGRFTGETPEPRAGMRSGHIPGSASLPYTDLLNTDGTFRNVDVVRARLRRAGVDGSRPVVTSCGSGVTACILTLGMRIAGLPEGAVYDGSWTEWGGRSDTPVETNQA